MFNIDTTDSSTVMDQKMWHSLDIDEVVETVETDIQQGLSSKEAEKRLELLGRNSLPPPKRKSKSSILLNQFNDLLIYILVVAALVTLTLSLIKADGVYSLEYFFDTIVIVTVLVINAILGFYQEWRAEIAVLSLQSMVSDETTVIRNGVPELIDSSELVVGDLVDINTGERLSADIRVIEATNLKVNESALTGESLSVFISPRKLPEDTSLPDRENIVYMGTFVESGVGKGIVVETGVSTEVGKISELVASIESFKTPLQEKLEDFSSLLAKVIIALSIFLVLFGVFVELIVNGRSVDNIGVILDLAIVGISLAVAAIPEGLPIILTFTLAISVQKLAGRNSIIRNLQAVETLGATTMIATDKTGTLTINKLQLTSISNLERSWSPVVFDELPKTVKNALGIVSSPSFGYAFDTLDPLDRAIVEIIGDQDISQFDLQNPFDSSRKMMSVIAGNTLGLKGAPDVVLQHSKYYLSPDTGMTEELRGKISDKLESLASEGYRVIGIAYRELEISSPESMDLQVLESDLIFLGFLTFLDPPRPEVYGAVKSCSTAGINVMMITGDHPSTAFTIAQDLGIVSDQPKNLAVLTGSELDKLDDSELSGRLHNTKVFARVTPAHKLRLVSLLKDSGEVVAMTGDGVNDSPALVKADIGVAMGIAGTDAAKESSDMILMDDNFNTLVDAVGEGRRVNMNIRKFTNYLLASNLSEVLILLLGFFVIASLAPQLFKDLIPLSETQILYLNLVTDSFLALALGLEVREKSIMEQPPRDPDAPIVGRKDLKRIIFIGFFISTINILVFLIVLGSNWEGLKHVEVSYAQSYMLTLLVITEVLVALSYRTDKLIWEINILENPLFIFSVVAVIISQLSILYIPLMNKLFDTQPLPLVDWVTILGISGFVFLLLEFSKIRNITRRG